MESAVVRLPLPRRQSPALLPTALWVDPGPLVVSKSLIVWCCCPDSNGGPTDYESVALPAELQQHLGLWLFFRIVFTNRSQIRRVRSHIHRSGRTFSPRR